MKRFIYLSILSLFIITSYSNAQSNQNVTFVPGLGDTEAVWDIMSNQLGEDFIFNRQDVSYDDALPISTAVNGISFPANSVTVAHSLGGLISREYLNENASSDMKSLVTIGTPHVGAPVADVIQSNTLKDLSGRWFDRLVAGPQATVDVIVYTTAVELGAPPVNVNLFRQLNRNFVLFTLQQFGLDPTSAGGALAININEIYGDIASVDDMRPGSLFLNQLNSTPENTLPNSRYAIFGAEGFYGYVRLLESFSRKEQGGDPVENGNLIDDYRAASGYWFFGAAVHAYLGAYYQYRAIDVGIGHPDFFKFENYSALHFYAAREWYLGHLNLALLMPIEWRANITQSLEIPESFSSFLEIFDSAEADDALLNQSTQAPAFFDTFGDNIDRMLPAIGANHVEETAHPSVRQRLIEIFNNENITPVDDGSGGGDPIDPPPFPDPCPPDENGNIPIHCPEEN